MKSFDTESRYNRLLASLKKAREQAGLTQLQAARLLQKPQSYVSKCESGERRVDFVELLEFARIYGKSVSFFEARIVKDEQEKLDNQ